MPAGMSLKSLSPGENAAYPMNHRRPYADKTGQAGIAGRRVARVARTACSVLRVALTAAGCAVRGGATPERARHLDIGGLHRRQGFEAHRLDLDELLTLAHGDADH